MYEQRDTSVPRKRDTSVPSDEHLIRWMSAVFSHITRKMNNVCIFSHDQVTYDITVIDCSSTTARVRYGLIPIYVSQ